MAVAFLVLMALVPGSPAEGILHHPERASGHRNPATSPVPGAPATLASVPGVPSALPNLSRELDLPHSQPRLAGGRVTTVQPCDGGELKFPLET